MQALHLPQTLSAPQTSPGFSTLRQSCTFSAAYTTVYFIHIVIVVAPPNDGSMLTESPQPFHNVHPKPSMSHDGGGTGRPSRWGETELTETVNYSPMVL